VRSWERKNLYWQWSCLVRYGSTHSLTFPLHAFGEAGRSEPAWRKRINFLFVQKWKTPNALASGTGIKERGTVGALLLLPYRLPPCLKFYCDSCIHVTRAALLLQSFISNSAVNCLELSPRPTFPSFVLDWWITWVLISALLCTLLAKGELPVLCVTVFYFCCRWLLSHAIVLEFNFFDVTFRFSSLLNSDHLPGVSRSFYSPWTSWKVYRANFLLLAPQLLSR